MANGVRKAWFGAARCFTVVFGACSIAWAAFSLQVSRLDLPLTKISHRILSGENFNAAQLSELKNQLDLMPVKFLSSSALSSIAVIRLYLFEQKTATGKYITAASDLADLTSAVNSALAESPKSSFLWLTKFWLEDPGARVTVSGLKCLRMSYLSAPNDAWIAVKRNPIALGVFSSLPIELADQVLSEFTGLVVSGLYQVAANILARSELTVRERLLGEIVHLSDANRKGLAKALESSTQNGIVVPGVDERPSRPY
jgi:hypothetical protein